MGADRRSHTNMRDRETVGDFVDANTVDRMHRRTRSPRGRTGHAFEACYFIPDNDGYPVSDPERPYALGLVGGGEVLDSATLMSNWVGDLPSDAASAQGLYV
jgi:hypothetical protein